MSLSLARALLVGAVVVVCAACSREPAGPVDVLAYVPADSPYVMANRIGTAKEITDSWLRVFGPYNQHTYGQYAEGPMPDFLDEETVSWLRILIPEFAVMGGPDGAEAIGLDSQGRYAIYGYGLAPVYRWQLADQQRFEALIERVEAKAGKALPTRSIGGITFHQLPASQADALFGIHDGYVVAAIAPPGQSEAQWSAQLGLTLPESSLLDAGVIAQIDQDYGFTGHMTVFVDLLALFDRLANAGPDRSMLIELGLPLPEIDPDCAAEMRSIVSHWPRMVGGSTLYQTKAMEVYGALETDAELAAKLQPLAASLPGEGAAGAPFRFAMGLKLPATIRLAGAIAETMLAQPYSCADLQSLNAMAAQIKEQAANPAVAMAGSVSAVSVGVTDLQLDDSGKPSSLSGHLSVGSGAPMMLWSMLQQSRPELAQTSLPADGTVVPLPEELLPAQPLPLVLKARMTASTLGVATQDVADAPFIAASDPSAQSDGTVMRYGMNGEAMAMLGRILPQPTEGMDEQQVRELENARKMFEMLGAAIGDIDVRIGFDQRGLYYRQSVTLR